MTDKERLEEIKNVYEDYKELQKKRDFKQADIALLYLSENHIDWLIQQAEKIELLNAEIETLQAKWEAQGLMIQKLHRENQRYKQALEEITQLGWSDDFGGGHNYMGEYHAQAIKISEKALEGEE